MARLINAIVILLRLEAKIQDQRRARACIQSAARVQPCAFVHIQRKKRKKRTNETWDQGRKLEGGGAAPTAGGPGERIRDC